MTAIVSLLRDGHRTRSASARLRLEKLEDRSLPSVDLAAAFEGISFADDTRYTPPDTHAAVGIDYIIETVNGSLASYEKSTGNRVFLQRLESFFAPVGGSNGIFDPVVAYLEQYDRFVVVGIDSLSNGSRFIDLAVSDDGNPLDGFTEMHRFDGTVNGAFLDYPKIGWNADALVLAFNMFGSSVFAQVVTCDLSTLLDGDPSTFYYFRTSRTSADVTMAPATMHGSNPGDPMWFVDDNGNGGSTMRVIRMDDVLSNSPTFTVYTVPVAPFGSPPNATERGGGIVQTDDARVMNVAYCGGLLVADHNAGTGSLARARWYEFDTTQDQPVLVQAGEIDQGPGVFTYYPSIDINAEGDLGMTFMESSSSEYVSMYVTGQNVADDPGTMQPPVLTHTGTSHYTGGRGGDYSGITVDPTDGLTFWAANMYVGSSFWNTGIAAFSISPAMSVSERVLATSPTTPIETDLREPAASLEPSPAEVRDLGGATGTAASRQRNTVGSESALILAGLSLNDNDSLESSIWSSAASL
jgi:hypothetical protein